MADEQFMVASKRLSRDGKSFDYASVGSIWPTVTTCENHQGYCQAKAEQRPERYGGVEYVIMRLTEVQPGEAQS